MKIDCEHEFDHAEDAQQDSVAEGLTATIKSVLNNPVLPLEFDFFASSVRTSEMEGAAP